LTIPDSLETVSIESGWYDNGGEIELVRKRKQICQNAIYKIQRWYKKILYKNKQ